MDGKTRTTGHMGRSCCQLHQKKRTFLVGAAFLADCLEGVLAMVAVGGGTSSYWFWFVDGRGWDCEVMVAAATRGYVMVFGRCVEGACGVHVFE